MMTKPKIVAVTESEGDEWRKFERGTHHHLHSILFEDGSTIDAWNGWRPADKGRMPPWVGTAVDGTGWAEAAFSDDVDPAQRYVAVPDGEWVRPQPGQITQIGAGEWLVSKLRTARNA